MTRPAHFFHFPSYLVLRAVPRIPLFALCARVGGLPWRHANSTTRRG